jgi:hypothetical protein
VQKEKIIVQKGGKFKDKGAGRAAAFGLDFKADSAAQSCVPRCRYLIRAAVGTAFPNRQSGAGLMGAAPQKASSVNAVIERSGKVNGRFACHGPPPKNRKSFSVFLPPILL